MNRPQHLSAGGTGVMGMALGAFCWLLTGFIWYSVRPRSDEPETLELIGLFALTGTAALLWGIFDWRRQRKSAWLDEPEVSFYYRAASASCSAPLVLVGAAFAWWFPIVSPDSYGDEHTAQILTATIVLISGLGLLFGFLSLFGIRRHGAKGILSPGGAGILLNGGILLWALMFLPAFIPIGP